MSNCQYCKKEITEDHSICEECFNRNDLCVLCGAQIQELDLYCDMCQKKRDQVWEEMISKIDPKELDSETETQLMILLDVGMACGKIAKK
jgi:hypothetical protein